MTNEERAAVEKEIARLTTEINLKDQELLGLRLQRAAITPCGVCNELAIDCTCAKIESSCGRVVSR